MLKENLGASHQDVLLWAIIGDILCIFDKNGLEKVDFRSTAVDGLVKVVYMLITVAGFEMFDYLLCCSDSSVIIEFLLICGESCNSCFIVVQIAAVSLVAEWSCNEFSSFFFLATDLTFCIDWVVPGVMPLVLCGLLIPQMVMSVTKLRHRHD